MPDNTHINVGIRRIKLGWVPEGVLKKAKVVRGNPRELGGQGNTLRELGGRMKGNPPPSHHGYLNISANIVGSSLKPGPPA